jgi:hypothetical protein
VLLKKEHYQHKSYGRIFTPVFDVVEWVAMDKEPDEEAVEEEVAPTRRRRAG